MVDQYAKEGKDKKVVFEANFSKPNCKPKWFFRKDVSFIYYTIFYFHSIPSNTFLLSFQELFPSSKYKFKNEEDCYQLIIMNPKVEDTGKYTIEISGVSSTAFLNVEG